MLSRVLSRRLTRCLHSTSRALKDTVFIKEVAAVAITGKDAWNRPTPQPIKISVALDTDFQKASETDDLQYSLNYAVISRNIDEYMKNNQRRNFKSLANIARGVSEVVLDRAKGGGTSASIAVKSTKSEIRADHVEVVLDRTTLEGPTGYDQINVRGLKLLTIIGVFTFERLQRQIVDIDLSLKVKRDAEVPIHDVIDTVVAYVEGSNFKTVEALVMNVGHLVFQDHPEGIHSIQVKVTKPNAISFTEGVGVSTELTKESFAGMEPIVWNRENHAEGTFNLPQTISQAENATDNINHVAYVAFGCNEGDAVSNISRALNVLETYGIKVLATSSMYRSKPMYYKSQTDFYNGAIKIGFANKDPHELLKILKEIEYTHFSRVKHFQNGPRTLDLDILLYDNEVVTSADLNVPHISMLERTFVLQPLCELIPPDFIHPVSAEPIHDHLAQLLASEVDDTVQESNRLYQITPTRSNALVFDHLNHTKSTLIMGILNVTPDSFSDGGIHSSINHVVDRALQLLEDGADILDIGGVSTRPGSTEPTEEEELARIIPVIKAIRTSTNPKLANCVISVDTYRSSVAHQCLEAGTDIINDISMGRFDPNMFDVVAKYGCPYIMNHSRGTPATMNSLTTYDSNIDEDIIEYMVDPKFGPYSPDSYRQDSANLINGISRELGLQMLKAFAKGVRKWQLIVDPGIGFAKTLPQNLSILKHAASFKHYSVSINDTYLSFNGLPTLVGSSRKKFLGTLTNEPVAKNRVISSASTVMACIEQNVDCVRVHDVKQIKEAVITGDAIYRDIY